MCGVFATTGNRRKRLIAVWGLSGKSFLRAIEIRFASSGLEGADMHPHFA
jgi:hypothetical protein